MTEKHHYVPVFYQKRWAGSDGKVCVYTRPHNKVVWKRRSPDYVGFEEDLYKVNSDDPETSSHLEQSFFMEGDNDAARVLAIFEANPAVQMDVKMRSAWSRFNVVAAKPGPRRSSKILERHIGRSRLHSTRSERGLLQSRRH